MNQPRITTEEDWLAAREALRAKEAGLIDAQDAVAEERRSLPMVKITKDYAFTGPSGTVGLLDLFEGRRQLLIYQFWFEPGEQPCEGCSMWAYNLGRLSYLHDADTSLRWCLERHPRRSKRSRSNEAGQCRGSR